MKNLIIGIAILAIIFVATGVAQNDHLFVGVKGCAACHQGDKKGNQKEIWQKSKHADAYNALTSDKALEIAKAKGIDKPSESKDCLPCHSVGMMVTPDMCKENFDVKSGVQCESCHGAGSDYKTMSIMKDKAKAIENGLTDFKDDSTMEAKCRTCHNEKSPTFTDFVFKDRWEKIKHMMPPK
jgi:hypothetical protein